MQCANTNERKSQLANPKFILFICTKFISAPCECVLLRHNFFFLLPIPVRISSIAFLIFDGQFFVFLRRQNERNGDIDDGCGNNSSPSGKWWFVAVAVIKNARLSFLFRFSSFLRFVVVAVIGLFSFLLISLRRCSVIFDWPDIWYIYVITNGCSAVSRAYCMHEFVVFIDAILYANFQKIKKTKTKCADARLVLLFLFLRSLHAKNRRPRREDITSKIEWKLRIELIPFAFGLRFESLEAAWWRTRKHKTYSGVYVSNLKGSVWLCCDVFITPYSTHIVCSRVPSQESMGFGYEIYVERVAIAFGETRWERTALTQTRSIPIDSCFAHNWCCCAIWVNV